MVLEIKDVVDEAIDDGGLADGLIADKDNFVLEESGGRDIVG